MYKEIPALRAYQILLEIAGTDAVDKQEQMRDNFEWYETSFPSCIMVFNLKDF